MCNSAEDVLDGLLRPQRLLMNVLGIEQKEELDIPSLLSASIGTSCEAAEVLDLLNKANRPWKPTTLNVDHLREEAIDTLFYLLEIFVLLGMDDHDVNLAYWDKFMINCARILETYPTGARMAAVSIARFVHRDDFEKQEQAIKAAYLLRIGGFVQSSGEQLDDNTLSLIYSPVTTARRVIKERKEGQRGRGVQGLHDQDCP